MAAQQKQAAPATPIHPALRACLAREEQFMGPGPYRLLMLLDRHKSVSKACREMGLSYSKAWNMIRRLEKELGRHIIVRQQGGQGGGQSELTDEGRRFAEAYRIYDERCQEAAKKIFDEVFGDEWV